MASLGQTMPSEPEIGNAVEALAGVAERTPLMAAPHLADLSGADEVYVKAESLQRTGSFKFRGAYWRCCNLSEAEKLAGVVAYSSGNFAQGLAAAAATLGIPATIVMPVDAPEAKRRKTEAYGATVVLSEHGDRPREEVASAMAKDISEREGKVLLHPFDDPFVVTGHASAASEIIEELRLGGREAPDFVFSCVGGGGLIAGLASGFSRYSPSTQLVAAEPEGFDSFGQSLKADTVTRISGGAVSICDALQATAPGEVPFACARAAGMRHHMAVGDDTVRAAMRVAFETLKLVLEPSGAVALAALLMRPDYIQGKRVVVMATGGNIDFERFCETLGSLTVQ
ncbi:threonine/serine dehydratase [Nisaea sp.]|uniref:threonine ammonia-lyase n=1 Tax=Nisaea sp. TaxID=2024842 RepID=UPI0032674CA0